VGVEKLDGLERICDLRGKQVTVLVADFRGRAFEVEVRPSALLEAITLF